MLHAVTKGYLKKIVFFYRSKLEYILALIVSLCIVLLCDILLYKYYTDKEVDKFNNSTVLFTKIIKRILLQDIQSAYYINNSEHLFCTQVDNGIQHSGIKKISIGSKFIFCNTRLIKERLDSILPEYINYKVSIDKTIIVSSNYDVTKAFSCRIDNILDDLILKTEIYVDSNSSYFHSVQDLTKSKIYFSLICSSSLWLLWLSSIFYLIYKLKKSLKQNTDLTEELKKLEIIKFAESKSKAFTNKFYNHSKTIHNFYGRNNSIESSIKELYDSLDYLPIPLLNLDLVKAPNLFKVQLEDTINELRYMVNSYIALNSYDIKFTSDIAVDHITIPFDQILFDQIMISLMANIIYFAKDKNNTRHISLIINSETITLVHDAFNLDKQMMIEYCERIFYETKNPYIINFGQIFIILNKIYKLRFDVEHVNRENILKIHLRNNKKVNENDNIISFKRTANE